MSADQNEQRLKPREIELAYSLKGIRGVIDLDAKKPLTTDQVKKALLYLEKEGKSTSDLEDWMANTKGVVFRPQNKRQPKEGEERVYKTFTQHNNGTPYLKIPINVLDVIGRGVSVKVRFAREGIVIEKMDA